MKMYIMFLVFLSLTLSVLFYFSSMFIMKSSMSKFTPFECGFEPMSNMRTPFSTRFFILMMLFLIFDIEVSLLIPPIFLSPSMSMSLVYYFIVFLGILLGGLYYEWSEKTLDWVST